MNMNIVDVLTTSHDVHMHVCLLVCSVLCVDFIEKPQD